VKAGNKLACLVAVASMAVFVIAEAQAARVKFRVGSGLSSVGRAIKTYPSTTLNPTRLKDCVDRENKLSKIEDSRSLLYAEIAKQRDELEKEKLQLDYIASIIDQRKKAAVADFNKRVDSFNQKKDKLNISMTNFNSGSIDFNRNVAKFNEECAGKLYYKDDLISARQELGLSITD
jgi:hypothetical protein